MKYLEEHFIPQGPLIKTHVKRNPLCASLTLPSDLLGVSFSECTLYIPFYKLFCNNCLLYFSLGKL